MYILLVNNFSVSINSLFRRHEGHEDPLDDVTLTLNLR